MWNIIHKKMIKNAGVFAILSLIAIVSCSQLLFQYGLPHTPNEDLARHAALALNFREALKQGQYIPRLQPNPITFPDLPVYQYYGFMSSAISQVGLWLHLPALNSVILGVVLCRILGLLALFIALKRVGVSLISLIIACCAYAFFPYLQTNLYGRAAIPEACAHGLLPILFLGYVYSITDKRWWIPVLLIAVGIVFLALAHPIFLLWGVISVLVLAIINVLLHTEYRYRNSSVLIFGLLFGMAMSSFQWYPAYISSKDLNTNFIGSSPYSAAYLTSLSGFLGLPKKLNSYGSDLYLTGVSWILPVVVVATFLFFKMNRRNQSPQLRMIIMASIMSTAFFCFLSISPVDIWRYLPHATYATQFPYRLLAFVALFSVVLLGICVDKVIESSKLKIALGGFIITLSGLSLVAPENIFGPRLLQQSNSEIVSSFSSFDYAVTGKGNVTDVDGWLIKENFIHLPKRQEKNFVTIVGHMDGLVHADDLSLWFVDPDERNLVVSDVFIVKKNRFVHTFAIKAGKQVVRLVASKYVRPSDIDRKSTDTRLLSIMIDGLEISCANEKLIISSEINREVINGYTRKFTLRNNLMSDNSMTRHFILTLPLAYSRFNDITQNGKKLQMRPNSLGLTLVNVENFSTPLISVYRSHAASNIISAIALIILILLSIYYFLVPQPKPA